jgi:trehalose-phosphatase
VEPEYFFEHKDPKLESGLSGIFLILDFDGTLVPIQNDPAKCVLSPGMKVQLEAIASSGKGSIAILSGRTVKDIKDRVSMEGIYYGGNHGIKICGPGINYTHPESLSKTEVIEKVCRGIEQAIGNVEGAFLEEKKFGFSLHYRMTDKEGSAFIKNSFYRIVSESPEPQAFRVLRGKKVLELAPNIQWDKGKAALFLLRKAKKHYLPIYVGDDLTDETAFKALKEKGITIRVGRSKKTAAKYYLKGQWEVSKLLKYIHKLIQ